MNLVVCGILFSFTIITVCYSKPTGEREIDITTCVDCENDPKLRTFRVKRLANGFFVITEKHEESHYQKSEKTWAYQGNVPIDFTQIFVGAGANNHNFIQFGG